MRYTILIALIVTVGVSCYWTRSKWMADTTSVPKDMETAWTQHKVIYSVIVVGLLNY